MIVHVSVCLSVYVCVRVGRISPNFMNGFKKNSKGVLENNVLVRQQMNKHPMEL